MTADAHDPFSKGAKERAAKRALTQAVRIESACAQVAHDTGQPVGGVDKDGFERLYLDELSRRPVPNRAARRECKRRGHVAKSFGGITICARCERRIA